MAEQWGRYFDHSLSELRRIAADEQLLYIHGKGEVICRRLDYLRDLSFEGLFDSNRFYMPSPNGKSPKGETPGPHQERIAASRQLLNEQAAPPAVCSPRSSAAAP